MFQFSTNDKNSAARRAPFRMTALRHNPYVGSFHGLRIAASNTDAYFQDESVDKNVGNTSTELGLKRILYQKEEGKPVLSQLKVSRVSTSFPVKRSFLASLKKIPLKVYSTSGGSKSSLSYHGDDPVCAICIEPYVDGDQLLTLSCSHCFHKECARKWFLQGCLNNADASSMNCPECRQEHQDQHAQLQQQQQSQPQQRCRDGHSVVSGVEEISSASFFDVGAKLINEGGYDFMSDFGSETSRTTRSHSLANLELKADTLTALSTLQEGLSQLAVSEIVDDSMSVAATVTMTSLAAGVAVSEASNVCSSSLQYSTSVTSNNTSDPPDLNSSSVVAAAVVAPVECCAPEDSTAVIEETEERCEEVGYTLEESTFSDCGYPLQQNVLTNAIPLTATRQP